ncbi:MAG: rhodanese-like domain-containing protein [Bacteroidetes bacterium]|nr:rhodanese-like domain-containing protein [Bacteroidota bacterium]
MLQALKNLFGFGPSVDFKELMNQGAVIVDVRSKGEYQSGHIKGSLNIPVDSLQNNLNKLKDKDKPVITCCASGMRSSAAKGMLKSKGYTNVHNGGSWHSLQSKIR